MFTASSALSVAQYLLAPSIFAFAVQRETGCFT